MVTINCEDLWFSPVLLGSFIHVYYWLYNIISPDRIQYIRKIRAKVRFGGMFIFFGGGDWILQHRHWPPTNSRKHVYILHIINGWPTFNHPKEWQPQKEQNNKGCSLQKGTSTKKDHPPPPRSFSIFRDVWLFTAMSWSNASFLLKAICNSVSMSFFWPAKTCRASPDQNIKTYELIMGIKLLDSKNHNLLPEQLDRSTDFGLLCFTYT